MLKWRVPLAILIYVLGGCNTFTTTAVRSTTSAITVSEIDLVARAGCRNIPPTPDPVANYNNMMRCLTTVGTAQLAAGIFPISQYILMPAHTTLSGVSTRPPTSIITPPPLQKQAWGDTMVVPFSNTKVIAVTDFGNVQDLKIVGNGRLIPSCCSTILELAGNSGAISNVEVDNLDPLDHPPSSPTTAQVTGIYYGAGGTNGVKDSKLHDLFHGVIFMSWAQPSPVSKFQDSQITRTACDALVINGNAIVSNNVIHGVGENCENGTPPIGGAAIYAYGNKQGGTITGNTIYDTCGNGLDLVNSREFVITNNNVTEDGSSPATFSNGAYSWCGGGTPGSFVGIQNSKISGNLFHAFQAPPLGIFLNLFPLPQWQTVYAVLPQASKQLIAVKVLNNPDDGTLTQLNNFDDNRFIATCDVGGPCIGTGLFVAKGTGLDVNGVTGTATANYFTRNRVTGSNIGSLRCGADWFAAYFSLLCDKSGVGPMCNDDDSEWIHIKGYRRARRTHRATV